MDALKIGLVAVGGYLLYEWYTGALGGASAPVGIAPSTTPIPTTSSVPVVLPSNVPVYGMPNAAQLTAAAGSNVQNIYQWNFWYNKLTGRGSGFDAVTFPVDGSTVVDVNTYLGYLNNLGLSGLGRIIDLQSLFSGVTSGSGFGGREFTTLQGLRGIVDDSMMSAGYIDEAPFNEAAAWGGSQSDSGTVDFYAAASGQGS